MSTTSNRRHIESAKIDAIDLCNMFAGCYERWEIAGSIRRGKPEVGDVEHVVIPRYGQSAGGLFGEPVRTNLLWQRLDDLMAADGVLLDGQTLENIGADDAAFIDPDVWRITRAVYGEPPKLTHRWGEKYRGLCFREFKHEIFLADERNYGCILAIRTGPADFSRQLVSRLHSTQLRQQDGYLKYKDGTIYHCPDEQAFFRACGVEWIEPAERQAKGT
jgi:DNA polymerase/3'-5' exonuclease PolX